MFRVSITILFAAVLALLTTAFMPSCFPSVGSSVALGAIFFIGFGLADIGRRHLPALNPANKSLPVRAIAWFATYWLPSAVIVYRFGTVGMFNLSAGPLTALAMTAIPAVVVLREYFNLSFLDR